MTRFGRADRLPLNFPNQFGPMDSFGWSWAYDPIYADSGFLAVNGTLYLIRLNVRELPTPFTDTLWGVHTVGVGPVAGQNWSGLYDSAGNRLVQANIDSTITTAGLRNVVFAETRLPAPPTPPTTSVPVFCWVALLFNAATPPTLARAAALTANMSNFGLLSFPSLARFGTAGAGLTTLPATITPLAITPIAASIWAAAG